MIYRLYGRNSQVKNDTPVTTVENNVNVAQIDPAAFEKRNDNQQLEFYDPAKARAEARIYPTSPILISYPLRSRASILIVIDVQISSLQMLTRPISLHQRM